MPTGGAETKRPSRMRREGLSFFEVHGRQPPAAIRALAAFHNASLRAPDRQ
ncbi:hypothetical protein SAMN05661107_3440 [Maritimibacter sp. HL-12]|jgi:hypothetical protein|nr:hypothetical protein SAMN05661107_3440 [Maritimibacter sp. HL-12]